MTGSWSRRPSPFDAAVRLGAVVALLGLAVALAAVGAALSAWTVLDALARGASPALREPAVSLAMGAEFAMGALIVGWPAGSQASIEEETDGPVAG